MVNILQSIFSPLTNLMSTGMQTFHDWGAPWWLSIMILTIIVRSLLFPLTVKQVKSMRKMQDLKPDLDKIKAQYKDDRQKQQEETMKLYSERSINPLGGCLPVLVQMPVFITLYYTIKHFDKLDSFRTGGLFWFKDLTVADPYYILPILYVITMMSAQEITIRNTAPQQAQLMRFMPLAFAFFLARFPSGLFMYWVTSNVITFVQNYLIYHRSPSNASAAVQAAGPSQKIVEADTSSSTPEGSVNAAKSGRARNRAPGRRSRGPCIGKSWLTYPGQYCIERRGLEHRQRGGGRGRWRGHVSRRYPAARR